MTHADKLENIRTLVQSVLASHDWQVGDFPAAGVKAIETACGGRQAEAWLPQSLSEEDTIVCLKGSFVSAGEDVLSSSTIYIPIDAPDKDIQALAKGFCAAAEVQISQAYSVRLLH